MQHHNRVSTDRLCESSGDTEVSFIFSSVLFFDYCITDYEMYVLKMCFCTNITNN